jgi:hypothetical protein
MFSQKVEWSENKREMKEKTLENMNKTKNKYEKEYLIDIKYFILLAWYLFSL